MNKQCIAREMTREMIVGVFMLMILLGLGYFTIILSHETWLGTKFQMNVCFTDVMGLREGDSVVARGMTIGRVDKLEFKDEKVKVILKLDENLSIYDDYKISIVTTSVLGGRHLFIDQGKTEPRHALDYLFIGEEPYDLMTDASALINAIRDSAIDGGMLDNFERAALQFRSVADSLASGKGTLGMLVSDATVYNDLAATMKSFRKVGEGLQEGNGVIGKLLTDEELFVQIEEVVTDIRETIDDYRESSPVATFSSIFFGAL